MSEYWLGFVSFPVAAAVILTAWAILYHWLSKDQGISCQVPECNFKYRPGARRRITIYVLWEIHRIRARKNKDHVEFYAKFKGKK